MHQTQKQKLIALVKRELQEYKNSFVLTPVIVSGLLLFLMMMSVLLANRITVVGDSVVDILTDDHSSRGMNITINIEDDTEPQDYRVTEENSSGATGEEDWNFSRGWTFNPPRADKASQEADDGIESLNPLFNALHCLFLLLLLVASCNYLLGTFHQDRRDRSILFWKSLPVSEGQEIASKMAIVCLLAPAIYLCISFLSQLGTVMLAMLMAWRLDKDPTALVLDNIDFIALFSGQLSGWLIWALWTAPFYAWLLLCSTAARRSPLMLAIAIPVALVILEQAFIGSDYVSTAISRHIPHPGNDDASPMHFNFHALQWLSLDFVGMALGLALTAALLSGAAWFRKHRFES